MWRKKLISFPRKNLAKIQTLMIALVAIMLLQCSGSLASGQNAHPAEPIVNTASFQRAFEKQSAPETSFSRPVLYWRSWSANPPPVVLTFLFLLLVTVVLSELFGDRIVVSGTAYSGFKSFFKSFGAGLMALIILLTLIRALFSSEIGAPLAWALLAILQLGCLIGFAVSATVVGQSFCTAPLVNNVLGSTRWRRILVPFFGTLIISVLLLMPKIGILSGIGIRLILQLCILGLGACLRTRMGTIELEASSGGK